jgi:hypothetical protein
VILINLLKHIRSAQTLIYTSTIGMVERVPRGEPNPPYTSIWHRLATKVQKRVNLDEKKVGTCPPGMQTLINMNPIYHYEEQNEVHLLRTSTINIST